MSPLWRPRVIGFGGSAPAGSGAVVRATYTVPTGKRAILVHAAGNIANNTGAVNTAIAEIYVNVAGAFSLVIGAENGGGAVTKYFYTDCYIDLLAADFVNLYSINNGAVAVFFHLDISVREYL